MNSIKRWAIWLIIFSFTLTVMAGAILGPVVSKIGSSLGVGQSAAGLIVTTHGLFIALFSPVWGYLIDRIGSKKPYVMGLLVYGIAGGSGLVINSYFTLIFSRVILGVSIAAIYTSITVLILNLYQGEKRNKAMGWRGSANSISASIWPLIGGALGAISWHLPFAIYLVTIPVGLLAIYIIPETYVFTSL